MYKPDVRAILEDEGFLLSSKPESQDICFISSSVSDFIEKKGGTPSKGEIKRVDGTVLGKHEGIYNFTVGQRKGLGVSAPNPLYVLSINSEDNTVLVGEKNELEREEFFVSDLHWISNMGISNEKKDTSVRARVKLRYRHEGVLCDIYPVFNERGDLTNKARLRFVDKWSTVSPGQAAVFSNTEAEPDGALEVLGGGIILKNV
jgi:tRNA-specific 2-thiouridylase